MTRRTVVLEIPGEAVAWARARVVHTRGGRTLLTTATRDRDYRALVRRIAEDILAGDPPLRGPIAADIAASWGPAGRVVATFTELPDEDLWHAAKPDADNVAKAILDALGPSRKRPGILLPDDAHVVDLRVAKLRAEGSPP